MRKLIFLFLTILAFSGIKAQNTYPVTVLGFIIDANGNAIANQDVNLYTDSVFNFNYNNTVATDANGIFNDQFDVPVNVQFGFLIAETADCNGLNLVEFGFWQSGTDTIVYNFILCDTTGTGNGPDSCFVDVICDPDGSLGAIAFGMPPFSYQWGSGDTTEIIFPQDTGLYCVTVTDATGCESEGCLYFGGNNPNGPDSC
ncbi:MAG: hypothetical protein KDC24_01940, partial [Saprospiraceae bacterium]|nr:hypothetical protein [Saprospiraceae bacterium]